VWLCVHPNRTPILPHPLYISLNLWYNSAMNRRLLERLILWIVLVVAFWAIFSLVPLDQPLLFYDWRVFFANVETAPGHYVPWSRYVTQCLTLPLLLALTVASFAVSTVNQAKSPISAACAFLCLPLSWTLFLGQLEGIALLGLLGMPYLLPLALVKPQLTLFAAFAKRWWLVALLIVGVATALIWGNWVIATLRWQYQGSGADWPQDIGLGLWGLPLFALIVWKMPREDPYWWMLAGTFVTPRLIPYNLLPLIPVVARLPWPWALGVALTSWLPLAANWLGPCGWWLTWVSILVLGVGLGLQATTPRSLFRLPIHTE